MKVPALRVVELQRVGDGVELDWADETNHAQLGDPVKGASFIYQVASGDRLPSHLPVGQDALDRRGVVTERVAREISPLREASAATGYGATRRDPQPA